MERQKIIDALEKQLQLLSRRSEECLEVSDLAVLTNEMLNLASFLLTSL